MPESDGTRPQRVSRFQVAASDVRRAEPAPRAVPATRKRALVEESGWGLFCVGFSAFLAFFLLRGFSWAFFLPTLFFLLIGVWLSSAGVRTLRALRWGQLVPAQVFLIDGLTPGEIPIGFLKEGETLPPGSDIALLESRTALGAVRAEYSTPAGTKHGSAVLAPGEIPFAVDFDGKISAAVCVHNGYATVWAGPAPASARVGP